MNDDGHMHCSIKGCTNTIPNHKWGKIAAESWFFTKDGKAYCPDHVPSWVAQWRKEQEK